ncbi:MAG: hypothetical protein LQ348_001994 [Seirophora lacunosa]|nr:MAG: hypothetical protein LQ348_001994 [Seirophora lacunosa]
MGVQAYITRLALGRSAYEPLGRDPLPDQPEESKQPSREETNQQNERQSTKTRNDPEQSIGSYVQRYDENGAPQNLTSQELARRSRWAQNEILAIAGVIQCPGQRYQESTTLPLLASDGAELQAKSEETDNNAPVGIATTIANLVSSLWFHVRVN